MPERVTDNRLKEFVETLERLGGAAGNGRLRHELIWDEEFYWRVQEKLIKDGKIIPGQGRGGSVRLTAAKLVNSSSISANGTIISNGVVNASNQVPKRRTTERPLYEPIKSNIESKWIKRFGFDDVRVEETHTQGSKQTGGTFTRPDLTVAGIRRYVFLPKSLEIITFEVKPAEAVGILGVLEAIAHREAAHRSYVVYAISRADFETSAEAERVVELAQKYGIGLLLTEDTTDVESWEILIDAIRHDPDPARLDRFLGDLPNETMKKQLHKWIT